MKNIDKETEYLIVLGFWIVQIILIWGIEQMDTRNVV